MHRFFASVSRLAKIVNLIAQLWVVENHCQNTWQHISEKTYYWPKMLHVCCLLSKIKWIVPLGQRIPKLCLLSSITWVTPISFLASSGQYKNMDHGTIALKQLWNFILWQVKFFLGRVTKNWVFLDRLGIIFWAQIQLLLDGNEYQFRRSFFDHFTSNRLFRYQAIL